MPTSVDIKNLKINKLTEAQYDAAVQGGVIGENELSLLTDVGDLTNKLDKITAANKLYGTNGNGDQVGYNLSAFAAAEDLDPLVIQWPVLPEPTASLEGVIYEYVGATNSKYTNGHFYKCTASGSTYVWEPISIQSEIDDNSTSTTATWSASKINSMIGNVESLLAAI